MAEYIEREAVINSLIKTRQNKTWSMDNNDVMEQEIEDIEALPTANVVEVVRCKDCAHCELRYPAKAIGEEAIEGYYCYPNRRYVKSNEFCSCGELKEREG